MRSDCPDEWQAGDRWAACAASVTGHEHRRRGLGCDDAYSYGIAGDFMVASVADGAGAVTGTSAWGAYVACQSVLNDALQPGFIDRYRDRGSEDAERLIRWLFENALDRVIRQAGVLGLDPTLLSTTLCVCLADRNRAVFGQIGDGVIAAEYGGTIESLLIEQKDDYANTTSFLQSDRAIDDAFRVAVHGGVTAFALSTDGMSYKITNVSTGEAYEPFFRDSWQHVRAGADADQFAALLQGIEDDQTGDDKTMILAAVRPASGGVEPPMVSVKAHSAAPAAVGARGGDAQSVPTKREFRRRRHLLGRRQR